MTEGNPAAREIHLAFRELEGRHGPAENQLRRQLWAKLERIRDLGLTDPVASPRGSDSPRESVDAYVRHAQRYGLELVFETALGFNDAPLSDGDLMTLARRLVSVDQNFNPRKLDASVVRQRPDIQERVDRIFGTGSTSRATRRCVICGKAIHGRSDRQTCSPAHQKRLQRRMSTLREPDDPNP